MKDRLDLAAEYTFQQLEKVGGDPQKLPLVLQPIALIYAFQGMVDNGGFRYPLESDLPFQPPYQIFVEAYRIIGANGAADCLARAVALLPGIHPERDAQARLDYMDSIKEDADFYKLSDMVCGDTNVWTLMQAYVEANKADFQL